jgi:hypothetical protein
MTTLLLVLLVAPRAQATETCGDATVQDSDNMADDACDPAGVTGVCESPLDCAAAGSVSPRTGAVVYRELPDVSFRSPYGPQLVSCAPVDERLRGYGIT